MSIYIYIYRYIHTHIHTYCIPLSLSLSLFVLPVLSIANASYLSALSNYEDKSAGARAEQTRYRSDAMYVIVM